MNEELICGATSDSKTIQLIKSTKEGNSNTPLVKNMTPAAVQASRSHPAIALVMHSTTSSDGYFLAMYITLANPQWEQVFFQTCLGSIVNMS